MTQHDSSNHQSNKPVADVLTTPSAPGRLDMNTVYRELKTSLMRFAYRYYRKPQDIEDVVQEAFVKVCEAQSRREIQHPKAYMYQTVRNLAVRQLRKHDHKLTDTMGDMDLDVISDFTPTLEEQFESRQKLDLFCRAVRELPVKCQRVYILCRVYGFSHQEIAEQMDISVKTVEAHLTKAILRCGEYMDAEEARETPAMQSAPRAATHTQGGHNG
jgi:RNA polymerase sigma-70 factor (ECF subfamily)